MGGSRAARVAGSPPCVGVVALANRLVSHFNEPQATTKMINSTNEQQAAAKCFQNQEKLFLKEVKVGLVRALISLGRGREVEQRCSQMPGRFSKARESSFAIAQHRGGEQGRLAIGFCMVKNVSNEASPSLLFFIPSVCRGTLMPGETLPVTPSHADISPRHSVSFLLTSGKRSGLGPRHQAKSAQAKEDANRREAGAGQREGDSLAHQLQSNKHLAAILAYAERLVAQSLRHLACIWARAWSETCQFPPPFVLVSVHHALN